MVIRGESGPDVTILDGQFQGRIMFFQGGATDLTVEGFTFKRGEAPSTGYYAGGGFEAHLSSPVLRDCIFRNNHAAEQGGAYWYGGVGAPELQNCHFINNSAKLGGAVFLINSPLDAVVLNCTFDSNSSTGGGGAIFTYNFKVSIDYCLFENNSASEGGALNILSSHPSSINGCTIVGNTAPVGAGINVTGSTTFIVTNTIVANNDGGGSGANVDGTSTLAFSCSDVWGNPGGDWVGGIASQLGGNGNISADPLFCFGGYVLQGNSPCSPGNHPDGEPCGVIGVFPVGCGSVAVERKTWGEIKSMFAD